MKKKLPIELKDCPNCKNRISIKDVQCPYCKYIDDPKYKKENDKMLKVNKKKKKKKYKLFDYLFNKSKKKK